MKRSETVYNSIALVLAVLLVFGACGIFFALVPHIEAKARGLYYAVVACQLIAAFILIVTSLVHLVRGRMLFPSTILQITTFIIIYPFLPMGVWGIVMLARQRKANAQQIAAANGPQAGPR